MDQDKLAGMREQWGGARSLAREVTFAGLKDLKAFKAGKELTNSARSTFLNCPQKYEYSYVYGLAPRKPSVPFLVGGLFHGELDIMYTDEAFDEGAMRDRVAEACEKACKFEGMTADDSDRIWAQQPVVCGMVKGYAELYLKKDLAAWTVIEAEGSFVHKMDNGWTYRGKKDLVMRQKKDKGLYLFEHKTTSRLDAGYVAKLPMDNQILGYAWAQRESTGKKFKGVMYNVTKKPQIKQRQTETLEQFYKRVEDDYMLNPGTYFYRELLTFSDSDLDRFGNELERFVRNIDRAHREKDFFQNAGHCTAMGVCPYMKLCLDGVNKETLLHYRVKERAHEELAEPEKE